jgi:tRNA threonylcarbamoyladenosine biosynthesis protein TsaB
LKLLAVDTTSRGCSAALFVDGQVTERFELAPRGHTRLLMPMVRALLAEAGMAVTDLDALGFACGPGSFTGLRIATGVIQGLAWGGGIPVVPVSSLQAMALQSAEQSEAAEGSRVAVAFDARMDEVYWGCFELQDGWPEPLAAERVCAPETVSLPDAAGSWQGAGDGWTLQARMPESVVSAMSRIDDDMVPRAAQVARLAVRGYQKGLQVPPEQAQPVYVRDEVTWQKLPGR